MTSTPPVLASPILFDRSHWGRIRLTGADRVRFLHNQTTNDIQQLVPGQGCHTVFVTSTGRTIDLAATYALEDALLVVVSPDMAQQLYDWMDRYIFFSDKVTLSDESEQTFMFTLIGGESEDEANSVIAGLCESEVPSEPFAHQTICIAGTDCFVTANSDLAQAGYTLIGPQNAADMVRQAFMAAGVQLGDRTHWETLRITQGRPMPGLELTDDENPLEAGLWDAISFEKGCYIGQETIARLNTYKGVKKRLWGLRIEGTVPSGIAAGATLLLGEAKVGKLTSLTKTDAGTIGLGYIRTKAGGAGLQVSVEGTTATVIELPFIKHEYYLAGDPEADKS